MMSFIHFMCCGQPWVWHILSERACDGLCRLSTFNGVDWNTIKGFNRACVALSDTLQAGAWLFPPYRNLGRFSKQANTHSFPSVPAFGSIWVVLWLLFFRSAPSTFPQRTGYLLGACFRESLVTRLHSEIGQIHLSIEAKCGSPVYLWVTATLGLLSQTLIEVSWFSTTWVCVLLDPLQVSLRKLSL